MKNRFMPRLSKSFITLSAAAFFSIPINDSIAAPKASVTAPAAAKVAQKPSAASASQLPLKLPAKKKTTKRTFIDMSDSTGVVIAPQNPSLNKAIQKSEIQKTDAEVRVQSRVVIPAPPGDLSEIPRAEISNATPRNATPSSTLKPLALAQPTQTAQASPVALPPMPIEPMHEFTPPIEAAAVQATTFEEIEKVETPVVQKISTAATPESRVEESRVENPPAPTRQTLAFVRSGYLQAKYGKFDSRMKDGATYVGLGVAREFETNWGSFEARGSVDAYHAMDQSVTVDNIRMLATRTEVGYWFTRTRVRPGISLGLGWTDYSVRSYRSIGSSTDQSNQTVVLKTHAKSQAFTVIPGTSLRIEVADGLVIDTQTEFLAILGGDSADAVQGLSFGVALGWIF